MAIIRIPPSTVETKNWTPIATYVQYRNRHCQRSIYLYSETRKSKIWKTINNIPYIVLSGRIPYLQFECPSFPFQAAGYTLKEIRGLWWVQHRMRMYLMRKANPPTTVPPYRYRSYQVQYTMILHFSSHKKYLYAFKVTPLYVYCVCIYHRS